MEGVTLVARSSWFGGVYREPKNFFAQFAVSDNYLDLYPELIVPAQQRSDYVRDRKGCLVGRQLATQFGFKVGDVIPIKGTIYPGTWSLSCAASWTAATNPPSRGNSFFTGTI